MMDFTEDWFSHNIPGITEALKHIEKPRRILEIGSFEGRSSCFWLQIILDDDGFLTCIDDFGGSVEHSEIDFEAVKKRFYGNTRRVCKSNQVVNMMEMKSILGLAHLVVQKQQYDLIYIDGSHTSPDTLTDAVMAWSLLKNGGLMIFDDYLWEMHTAPFQSPKWAIDTFTTMFCRQLKVVLHGYQVGVIKTSV